MVDLSKLEQVKKSLSDKLEAIRLQGNTPSNLKERLFIMKDIDSIEEVFRTMNKLKENSEQIFKKYNYI